MHKFNFGDLGEITEMSTKEFFAVKSDSEMIYPLRGETERFKGLLFLLLMLTGKIQIFGKNTDDLAEANSIKISYNVFLHLFTSMF